MQSIYPELALCGSKNKFVNLLVFQVCINKQLSIYLCERKKVLSCEAQKNEKEGKTLKLIGLARQYCLF